MSTAQKSNPIPKDRIEKTAIMLYAMALLSCEGGRDAAYSCTQFALQLMGLPMAPKQMFTKLWDTVAPLMGLCIWAHKYGATPTIEEQEEQKKRTAFCLHTKKRRRAARA